METKKYTQVGTFSLIVLTPILIFSLVMIFFSGSKDLVLVSTFGFLALSMIIGLLIFYKLTIFLDDTSISFKLGIGLISRKYLFTDIQSCKAVRNNPAFGVGIRMIPDGWLYNVSGLSAIELTFKNKKTKIRIGTDKPDEISEILGKLIEIERPDSTSDYKYKSGYLLAVVILLVCLTFPTLLILSGSRDTVVTTTDTDFRIKGMYGIIVKYSDIRQLDTIADLPGIKARTNGYALGVSYKGNFRLRSDEKAKLFIRLGVPPYIFIKTEKLNIYLNFRNRNNTLDLFNTLTTKLINKSK